MGAGKSSLVLRFVKGQFLEFQESTIGATFFSQTVAVNDATVKFEIWDTAGQERYHSLAPMYYKGAAAAIIVYDITTTAHVYYKTSNDCAAFLANYGSTTDANVTFNGYVYFLPAWSVSILPDCRNVIFNTAKVVSRRNLGDTLFAGTISTSELSLAPLKWSWYEEVVGVWSNDSLV